MLETILGTALALALGLTGVGGTVNGGTPIIIKGDPGNTANGGTPIIIKGDPGQTTSGAVDTIIVIRD